jgi:PhnB protein
MKLHAYLGFRGNCEEAINFYKEAFDGEISQLSRYGESPMETTDDLKDKIMHARLQFGDILIMFSDMMGENEAQPGSMINLSIECDSIEQLERVFPKVAEGGKITMPLQDQFWGARFGMLTDKYGIHWMFNCEKKK